MRRGFLIGVTALVALPAMAAAQTRSADAQRRRNQIQLMEGVLSRAVRLGAEQLTRQMQAVDPTMTVLTGQARARGFVLDGYGVFFDVEVPSLSASAVWSMMTVQQEAQTVAALDAMRRALAALPEGPRLQEAQQAFQVLATRVGPSPSPGSPLDAAGPPAPNAVTAASVTTQSVAPPAQTPDREPLSLYAEAVKTALVEAMLDHSLPMDLGPDEWLTVAARQSEGALSPSEIYESSTIVLRVKGSDLAAYAADRSRRAEIRERVEVRVF